MNDISDIKVGDELCYRNNYSCPTIIKIVRITPSGRLVDNYGTKYDKNGREIGGGKWHRKWLEKVTDGINDEILTARIFNYINNFSFKKLSLNEMKAVYKILKNCAALKEEENSNSSQHQKVCH